MDDGWTSGGKRPKRRGGHSRQAKHSASNLLPSSFQAHQGTPQQQEEVSQVTPSFAFGVAWKCKCSTNNLKGDSTCNVCDRPLRKEGEGGDYVEVPCDPEGVDLEFANAMRDEEEEEELGVFGKVGGSGGEREEEVEPQPYVPPAMDHCSAATPTTLPPELGLEGEEDDVESEEEVEWVGGEMEYRIEWMGSQSGEEGVNSTAFTPPSSTSTSSLSPPSLPSSPTQTPVDAATTFSSLPPQATSGGASTCAATSTASTTTTSAFVDGVGASVRGGGAYTPAVMAGAEGATATAAAADAASTAATSTATPQAHSMGATAASTPPPSTTSTAGAGTTTAAQASLGAASAPLPGAPEQPSSSTATPAPHTLSPFWQEIEDVSSLLTE